MFVGKNILAKFDDQLDPMKNFGVMALELAKINLVRSVTWISFNALSSNFVSYGLELAKTVQIKLVL